MEKYNLVRIKNDKEQNILNNGTLIDCLFDLENELRLHQLVIIKAEDNKFHTSDLNVVYKIEKV